MEYISEKIDGQNLTYRITTQYNGEEISFNVVCANDESEVPELVQFHLNYLDNPAPVVPVEPPKPTKEELMAKLQELQAQIMSLDQGAQ